MPQRVTIYVNGILTFPGSSNNWNGRAVTWTHLNRDARAEKVEYFCGPIDRAFGQKERAQKQRAQESNGRSSEKPAGALAGVPVALPALTRALKLQAKAGKVGFDWNDPRAVLAKIREEADEIEAELAAGDRTLAGAEVGDLLFAVVNLARHLDADPEAVLAATNRKFERRFAAIEQALADRGKVPREATLEEMDDLWNAAKATEE